MLWMMMISVPKNDYELTLDARLTTDREHPATNPHVAKTETFTQARTVRRSEM